MVVGFMAFTDAALAEQKIGIVVMHGKWDSPYGHMLLFARRMESAGFLVESPEMLWSERRAYDSDMASFIKEISAAVKTLKEKGAAKVCLAGHSSGGAGAVYYASLVKTDCVIAMAPAPYTGYAGYHERVKNDLARAKEMVALGKGNETASFLDLNSGGRSRSMRMAARIFIEQNDIGGPIDTEKNASHILPGTAVLWIFGAGEEALRRKNGDDAYAKIPNSVIKKFVVVQGDHLGTPDESSGVAIEWIRTTLN